MILTFREREIIRRALTIACESGYFYPGGNTDEEDDRLIDEVDAVVKTIRHKLDDPSFKGDPT